MRGDFAPRREAGQGTSADVAPSLVSSGRGVERAGETRGQDAVIAVADPICANEAKTYSHEGANNFRLHNVIAQAVANPLTHRMHKGVNTTTDEGQTMIAFLNAEWRVRRLMPIECERLQGFEDNYTDIPLRRRNHTPDAPRYRALGNSMAVNCMAWLGERIAMVAAL